ncbi:hypothetical protein [Formosa maritima]|uniref:Uncharacterized protein n=1 Tax=Formosa maritima TaxID=2592046 RepID=A0A5D0GH47_9FLAO|nr:hypothetical protein [Formosa maritima]TYA58298.1 hypothetical protein FVF61_03740 [Formosa maritima]
MFWAIFYFAIAILGRVFTYKKEIYPFFRWSLYSKTPNKLVYPYILVKKVGDSILPKPTNILDLYSVHDLALTDLNLMVNNFYQDTKPVLESELNYQGIFMKVLPENSEFTLYIKELDLSVKDYKNTEKHSQVLSVKNNKIIPFERNN